MRKKGLFSNENALSIVQDTLLFLVFISISALILSPNIIQSGIIQEQYDDLYELKVQETLLTLLNSNNHKFSYKTGSESIDATAQQIGINTKDNNSMYQRISSHFLEKEQYHKSIRQLVSEHLYTQYKYQYQNQTINLNPFSGNSEKRLSKLIQMNLNQMLPSYIEYNFSAHWYPFDSILFGGSIMLGKPIPIHSSTFSSHQEISLPILPCVNIGNSTFCFHSSYFKNNLNYLMENVDCIHNLSILFHNKEMNQSSEHYAEKLSRNVSKFIQDLFIDGIRSDSNETLIPSAYDILLSHLFSENPIDNTHSFDHEIELDSFHYLDSFFSFNSNDVEMINTDISSVIMEEFADKLEQNIQEKIHLTTQDLSVYIKKQLSLLIQPLTISLTDLIVHNILLNSSYTSNLESIIDICFNHLSLSSAEISLTIWRE